MLLRSARSDGPGDGRSLLGRRDVRGHACDLRIGDVEGDLVVCGIGIAHVPRRIDRSIDGRGGLQAVDRELEGVRGGAHRHVSDELERRLLGDGHIHHVNREDRLVLDLQGIRRGGQHRAVCLGDEGDLRRHRERQVVAVGSGGHRLDGDVRRLRGSAVGESEGGGCDGGGHDEAYGQRTHARLEASVADCVHGRTPFLSEAGPSRLIVCFLPPKMSAAWCLFDVELRSLAGLIGSRLSRPQR